VAAGRYTRNFFICLSILLPGAPMFGIDRDRRIDQLYHTAWTLKDGAPGEVQALAQTADGYLWLGCPTGLFRFDGVRFERYEPSFGPAFPKRRVVSLLAVPDGGLWIGFLYGGVSFLKDGRATNYSQRDGLPSASVRAFARDQQGVIWGAAKDGGLVRLEGSHWRTIGADWNFSGDAVTVFVDRLGTVWVGTLDRVFFLPKGAEKFQEAADRLTQVTWIAESSSGAVWIADVGSGVQPVLPRNTAALRRPKIQVGSLASLFDDQGSLWVTSMGDGLRRVPHPERLHGQIEKASPEAELFGQKNGLTGDYMECILQDREGSIWIGTNTGLDRFRQSAVVPVPVPAGFSVFSLVAGDRGVVWAAPSNRDALKIQDGKVVGGAGAIRNFDTSYRDRDGVIWVESAGKLFRFANERFQQAADPGGTAEAITADFSGRLWVSLRGKKVIRSEKDGWTNLVYLGGPKGMAISEFTDVSGRIWFGFNQNTVAALNGERAHTFGAKDGIGVGDVMSIKGRGSNIWIGGEFGLAFFDGTRFRPMRAADGIGFSGVTGLIVTASEGLWFSEDRGIVQIPEAELDLFARNPEHAVKYRIFDLLDGLPAILQRGFTLPSVTEGTDGLLWFATSNGVVWVDPKRVTKNTLPPPISIVSISANGMTYPAPTPLTLPPRTESLQIAYTALSLSVPERVRFRYKLEGQDKDWQDVGGRRQAFYTNVGPGSYRFRVIACNNDGVWNEAGAVADLIVQPAFFQTTWFRAMIASAVGGLLWMLYLLRLRQLSQQMHNRLETRLAERERIARELHDTLLQGFQGLTLHFQAAMKQIPDQEPARHMMNKALHIADQVLLEGRERVRDLRAEPVAGNELSKVLASYGEELAQDRAVTFKLTVVGSPADLHPVAGDEIYRIAREALTNAFHHSQASSIEVEITYDSASFSLRVRDNGCGIEQDILGSGREGHWGLRGMRERAQNISAQLSIWSNPGSGTEMDLRVPARFAYTRTRKQSTWSWIKRGATRGA
jgi:signal transduction histidine kinase/ligand-binding sensor domain-containing protein